MATHRSEPIAGAQSIRRALAVLRIVAGGQENGVRLVDVTSATGLERPTAHRILRALIEEKAVEQDLDTRRYRIGREMSLLGLARSAGFPIRAVAAPHLRHLADTLGDTVFLTIRNGDDSVCIARALGNHPMKVLSIDIGARRALGLGVSGVMLLAALPYAEAVAITERNRARLRSMRIQPSDILERCMQARVDDYAYAATGVARGTRAIGVPVRTPDGETVAGIAATAITSRLPDSRLPAVVQAMRERAELIGRELAARTRN